MIAEMQIKTGTKKRNSHLTVSLGSGSCLSSHAVAGTVLSVYEGLTSVFANRNRYSQARTAIDQMDIHFKKRLVVSNY